MNYSPPHRSGSSTTLFSSLHSITRNLLLYLCMATLAQSSGWASPIAYDGFGVGPGGYTDQANLANQGHGTGWNTDWTTTSTGDDLLTNEGSLAPPGFQNEDGQLVRVTASGNVDFSREYITTFGGATPTISEGWFSFLLQRNGNERNVIVNPFSNNTGGGSGQFFGVFATNGSLELTARIRYGNSVEVADSTNSFTLTRGKAYIVVGQVLFADTGTHDVFNVWVDEAANFNGTLAETPTMTTSYDISSTFTRWTFTSGNPNGQANGLILDEFRLGTSYGSINPIPEPASAVLLGLAGFALLLRRSRMR